MHRDSLDAVRATTSARYHSIIEAYHGQVCATSNDGGGSTFSFRLPLGDTGGWALAATGA
jgi:hypothetical protein